MIIWLLKKFFYHSITFSIFILMVSFLFIMLIAPLTLIYSEVDLHEIVILETGMIIFLIPQYYLFRWIDRKNDNAWTNFSRRIFLLLKKLFDLDIKEKYYDNDNLSKNKQNSETSSVNYELDQFSNKEYSADGIASTLRQFGKDYISDIEKEIKKIKENIELNNGGGKISKGYNLINIEQLIDKSIVLEGDNE